MVTLYLKRRTPYQALKMETPFKMLHGEEADLSHICVIGTRTFVHIKDTLENSMPWPGKGKFVATARRANHTQSGTQRLAPSWRAGTSPSSRHRRTFFPRRKSTLRYKIWCRRRGISSTTPWIPTTSRTTTKELHRCYGLPRQHYR